MYEEHLLSVTKVKKNPNHLTQVRRHVLKVHGLTDLTVRGPPELHLDSDRFGEFSVVERRRAEHDCHLPVDIRLGECALSLPGVLEEAHLNVLCRGTAEHKHTKMLKAYFETPA